MEIDARLSIFAFQKKKFVIFKKNLTIYNHDKIGITSKYKKFSKLWWRKRSEAFDYLFLTINSKLRIRFLYSADYFFTRIINFFI